MKYLRVLLAALLITGLMAGAASAKDDGGVFAGTAEVGSFFATPCDNSGTGTPAGKGLYAPTVNDHNAVYSLETDVISLINGPGFFAVCGYLTKFAGIGAACGWTKGYNGQGKAFFPAKSLVEYDLNDIEWKFAAAHIVLKGSVQETALGTKTPTKVKGSLLAVVQAADAAAGCVEEKPSDGATEFEVAGAYLIQQKYKYHDWNYKTDWIDPKDDGKSCNPSGEFGKTCEGLNLWGDKK